MVKALFVSISFLNKKCNKHGQYVSWAHILSNTSTKPVNINDIGQGMLRLGSACQQRPRKSPFPWGSVPPCGIQWYCSFLSKKIYSIWRISLKDKRIFQAKAQRLKHIMKLLKIILSKKPIKSHSQSSWSSKRCLQLAVIWYKMPVQRRLPLS